MMQIRVATLDDIAALAPFAEWIFRTTFDYIPYSQANLERYMSASFSDAFFRRAIGAGEMLIGQADVRCIAYSQMSALDMPVAAPIEPNRQICRLYVHPDYQGKGLAQQMMQRMLERAANHTLYLSVYHENLRAQRFYQRYGFRKVGEYDYFVGDHIDREWIMQRDA
jgi:ribosomal protein S18 acetylase RimI-like enzyme